MRKLFVLLCFVAVTTASAQLKYLIEDFEGLADGTTDLQPNGLFSYGNAKATADSKVHQLHGYQSYAGSRAIRIDLSPQPEFGGWGKGLNVMVNLDPAQDYFNMYYYFPVEQGSPNRSFTLQIELQEDDNSDNVYHKDVDDAWTAETVVESGGWKLLSIPLSKFADGNSGGDGQMNIGYKGGRLFNVLVSFPDHHLRSRQQMYCDFMCFSKGRLPTGAALFDPPFAQKNDCCSLGAWSHEGNSANFAEIASAFEKNFAESKKLGIVHFFQPFGKGGKLNHFPSIERINKVIREGYIPMITLEDHFTTLEPGMIQPNLYSIVEGHFDSFLGYWAHHIKQVQGTVILRILHEFNGDWYPWSVPNNDHNPQLLAKAYRYIHNIFKENKVENVKWIWCPNSMSLPQESWNDIMDAYPGDAYVDFTGLDIYNGAGQGSNWRSFRKEAIENYFVLTQQLSSKPLLICETASRERRPAECSSCQDKAEWIRQMSEALTNDMSKVRLLAWFNEKESFRINSSSRARNAYQEFIMNNDFFAPGTKSMLRLLSADK